jgi:hypothetical protein
MRSPILADVVGVLVLGVLVAAASRLLLPDDGFRFGWASMAFALLTFAAISMWHSEKISKTISGPTEWAATVAFSFVLGAASFGIDLMVGSMRGNGLSLIQTAEKAGSPFGFPLTVFLCPGLTLVAIAGFVRSLLPWNPK